MIKIIGPNRPSLTGDLIVSLPTLTFFEKIYPSSYKVVYIDRKCWQVASLLINHPLIDKIYISEEKDNVTENERSYFNGFDIVLEPYGHNHSHPFWYNYFSVQEETFKLNYFSKNINSKEIPYYLGYINSLEWEKLTPEEQHPKLYQYFDLSEISKSSIALWAEAGYANNDPTIKQRSPSVNFWQDLIIDLTKLGYDINQYGHPNSTLLNGVNDRRNLSLLEATRESLACKLCVTTDSGASHVLNAYGKECVCLYTNWRTNHNFYYDSLCPVNWKNNLVKVFGLNNIDNINKEEVINGVKLFK